MPRKNLNRTTVDFHPLPNTKMMVFGGGNFVRAFILYFLNEYNKSALEPFGAIVVKVTESWNYYRLENSGWFVPCTYQRLEEVRVIDNWDLISCVSDILAVMDEWLWMKTAETPLSTF
ncbi:MAG: hypothetical protein IPL23_21530 [Saprospiraceae bacterium]|nr:hypothetical protein [Saprospiraceae bacterium]